MATQIMQAMGPSKDNDTMKPPGSLPSPTLTNPDMVLPDEPVRFPALTSPSRRAWRERPPSPSYLRDKTNEEVHTPSSGGGSAMATPKREKRGLMSRKMMLLRSRTASSGSGVNGGQPVPRSVPSERASEDYGSAYGSSPTLMDVGNLAPEQLQEQRRPSASGSSAESEDMAGLPQFLAKCEAKEVAGTDDELDGDSPAPERYEYSVSIESGLDAHRRQQEQDEQNSAILSKRAEQILANAKKRLNLMEGNLRGARDLVQPLTAANLKRATSVGSSYVSSGAGYGGRVRNIYDDYHYEPSSPPTYRKLHAQASSPTIGQDYQGHWRGFSETKIPDRPHTALERTNSPIRANGRIPTKASDPAWTNALKGSRSYDSLGNGALRRPVSRDPMYSRGSPDPNLAPLVEDDGQDHALPYPQSRSSDRQDGLGIHRPSSRTSSQTDDLREQMSSLKGRISSLKERAREDSLRRQSIQNLREPSPLNNATVTAPEIFYTSSQNYGSPVLDTNAGVGLASQNNSPVTPQSGQRTWEPNQVLTGSRNAFAEQAHMMQQQGRGTDESSQKSPQKQRAANGGDHRARSRSFHKRTPSGTAIVQSSKHRYSHHQYYHVRKVSGSSNGIEGAENGEIGVAQGEPQRIELNRTYSETEASVYEDAEPEQSPAVVAHEDREDAFDYEHFFLHSAMSATRRSSTSSEHSVSSSETARGPTTTAGAEEEDGDGVLEEDNEYYLPSSPETPERLRELERSLHKRTFSDESVSTVATFATATEGRTSPVADSKRSSILDWPIPRSESTSLPNSRPSSRPSTAIPIKRPSPIARSDSSSERADSGVGLPHRPYSSQSSKRSPLASIAHKSSFPGPAAATTRTLSPPMSPRTLADPATVAVNALLEPHGRQLGLKDKALLFGLVENLKNVCHKLQEREEGEYESRMLRRRLDDARRALDGVVVPRPGSN